MSLDNALLNKLSSMSRRRDCGEVFNIFERYSGIKASGERKSLLMTCQLYLTELLSPCWSR
jgi:hypothetical protein